MSAVAPIMLDLMASNAALNHSVTAGLIANTSSTFEPMPISVYSSASLAPRMRSAARCPLPPAPGVRPHCHCFLDVCSRTAPWGQLRRVFKVLIIGAVPVDGPARRRARIGSASFEASSAGAGASAVGLTAHRRNDCSTDHLGIPKLASPGIRI